MYVGIDRGADLSSRLALNTVHVPRSEPSMCTYQALAILYLDFYLYFYLFFT